MTEVRAEILVNGLVQGVGFRYFVSRRAELLDLKGYVQNLYTGQVLTVVEGPKEKIEELINNIKIGPSHSSVKNCRVEWLKPKNEFTSFGIKH